MDNTITFDSLHSLLTKAAIEFKVLVHQPTKTSEESAKIRGVTLESGAKAMLLVEKKTDTFSLFVISAAKKLSWKKVRVILNSKNIDLATEEQVYKITQCLPGGVPPFGSVFKVQTYLDQSLIEQGDIMNFNGGLRTHSISMLVRDYLKVELPKICQFSD